VSTSSLCYRRKALIQKVDPAETAEQRKERYRAEGIEPEPLERHQAVFHLDFETWEDLIDALDLKKSIIPNRLSENVPQVSASGWYG